jgi:hypothetical protein
MVTTTKLTRLAHSVIPRADQVLCTMSDGTNVTLDWSKLASILGDDLVRCGSQQYEARRIPTDVELLRARH